MTAASRAVVALAVTGLVAAGCGDEPAAEPFEDPFEQVERALPDERAPERSAPRWEEIMVLSGDGHDSVEFPISDDALQWRLSWSCASGGLRIRVDGAEEPLVDAECPAEDVAYATETGFLDLAVQASGSWEAVVEQQVDTVYTEPALAGMDEGAALAAGGFYGIERSAEGTATLYGLPDGRVGLRLGEGFQTLASPDLYVWLSEAHAPATSADVFAADRVDLGEITTTFGDHNYVLPDDVDVERIRSVVIWCAPVQIAYGAAALEPASHTLLERRFAAPPPAPPVHGTDVAALGG